MHKAYRHISTKLINTPVRWLVSSAPICRCMQTVKVSSFRLNTESAIEIIQCRHYWSQSDSTQRVWTHLRRFSDESSDVLLYMYAGPDTSTCHMWHDFQQIWAVPRRNVRANERRIGPSPKCFIPARNHSTHCVLLQTCTIHVYRCVLVCFPPFQVSAVRIESNECSIDQYSKQID
jgi:hypothetical protein